MENILNKVWSVLRPNLNDNKVESIGIMGTGFFISESKFITSYHLLNKNSFQKDSDYNSDYLILKNISGIEIIIKDSENINYFPDKDITIINLKEKFDFFDLSYKSEKFRNIMNLGFPSDLINKLIDKNIVLKKVIIQKGNILKEIEQFTSSSNDVNINNKKVIVTNYSSSIGFSGGPLINNEGKVIGIMSMVIPDGNGIFSNKAIAISAREF